MTSHANVSYLGDAILYTAKDGQQFTYSPGDFAWVLSSGAFVLMMCFGVGCFYAGLLRRSSMLSMLLITTAIVCMVTTQWFVFGYTSGSSFLGDLKHIALTGAMAEPSDAQARLPRLLEAVYQLQFAIVTVAIAFGSAAERGSIGGTLLLAMCWATLVYPPIAHAVWHPNGFLFRMGALDWAGGDVVHVSSGTAALAYSFYLGQRVGYGKSLSASYRPGSVAFVVLGTAMMLFGWLGFNGGSAGVANFQAVQAVFVTIVGGSSGGLTWLLLDYRLARKWSAIALCSGVVAGCVAVTPCAGYIGVPSAFGVGIVGAAGANLATRLKYLLRVDETLDIFAVHGVSGFIGSVMLGIFADKNIMALSGIPVTSEGGWVNGHYMQILYQLGGSSFSMAYSGCATLLLCFLIDLIPGVRMRVPDDAEKAGIDITQIGEHFMDLENLVSGGEQHFHHMSGDHVHELSVQPSLPGTISFQQMNEELVESKINRPPSF